MWTNNGLTLVATAVQTNGAQVAMQYVGISPGCGALGTAITQGVPVTSLALAGVAGLPTALSSSQQLTITDGTNSETVTVVGGAAQGATSIPINSWTPAHNYAINVTAICPTPLATDTALYGESQRLSVAAASAGSSPGESLISGYFDGTQPTAVYVLVGFFGGATASSAVGTGTLMTEGIQVWNHVQNSDTFMYLDDNTI